MTLHVAFFRFRFTCTQVWSQWENPVTFRHASWANSLARARARRAYALSARRVTL